MWAVAAALMAHCWLYIFQFFGEQAAIHGGWKEMFLYGDPFDDAYTRFAGSGTWSRGFDAEQL